MRSSSRAAGTSSEPGRDARAHHRRSRHSRDAEHLGDSLVCAQDDAALSYALDADDNAGPNSACLPEVGLHLTVNGTVQPAIDIDPGERQLFRVSMRRRAEFSILAIDNERLGIVAIDGYPVGAYPGNPAIVWAGHIDRPAGRARGVYCNGAAGPTPCGRVATTAVWPAIGIRRPCSRFLRR